MELLVLLLLPLLAIGLSGGGSDDEDDGGDSNGPDETRNEILRDDGRASAISGLGGDDLLLGAGGNDTLSGGDGADAINGEAGADVITGGDGDDLLLGSWGQDDLSGGAGDDVLIGGTGNDILDGGSGDDLMVGSSGFDTLYGGDGDDDLVGIDARPELGIDRLVTFDRAVLEDQLDQTYGDAITDGDVNRIVAGIFNANVAQQGADFLFGGAGSDVLLGDNGDEMSGGDGVDAFGVFVAQGDAVTTILDFDPATETLDILVEGPPTGLLTYRDDALDAGVEVLLDGDVVAYLDGVMASQINPAAIVLIRAA